MVKRIKAEGDGRFIDSFSDHVSSDMEENVISRRRSEEDERKDFGNIMLLMFLYILQGIPLGLAGSVPMIMQQRDVSYKDQALFSLSFWPFSVKLLWAPIVDSCYWRWMGRRKSWLIPSQYMIGILMLMMSFTINSLLGDEGSHPRVMVLTCAFFVINFLAATQDIAVDGWALTILSRKNIGWASTCNSVGQTAGYFLGYVVFLALESKDFCRNYLGMEDSLVTLPGFFYFWGLIFMATTSLVWVMKSEPPEGGANSEDDIDYGLVGTYKILLQLLKTKSVQTMILILMTVKIGFAAADSLTVLKLTEGGVPRERLALLSIPLTPVQIFLPLFISKYTTGPRPLDIYLKAFIPRLFLGLLFALVVYSTPLFRSAEDGHIMTSFYVILIFVYLIHQVAANCMFVSQMAFYARISDSKVGGTYMTLLNTFTNLGGNWPAWVALRFVSELTWKACSGDALGSPCNTDAQLQTCKSGGGECVTQFDGYYIESLIFFTFGLFWYMLGAPIMRKLQYLPKEDWSIK